MGNYKIREFIPQKNKDDFAKLLPAYLSLWNDIENHRQLSFTMQPIDEETAGFWFRHHIEAGGKYLAARKPVLGPAAVSLFLVKVTRDNDPAQIELSMPDLCGLPAIYVHNHAARPQVAARSVLGIRIDPEGKICSLYSVLADDKLAALT